MMLVGTHWFCRCGREYKRPVVSVDLVNELRAGLKQAIEIIDGLSQQQAMADNWYLGERDRLQKLIHDD